MTAFVVPLTQDGRLSAKEFIGNKAQMQADQTTFAAAVRDLGLQRGIEGSKARHTRIQAFYEALSGHQSVTRLSKHRRFSPRCCARGFSRRTWRRRKLWPSV